jgi:uncharacterized Zn-finger protein
MFGRKSDVGLYRAKCLPWQEQTKAEGTAVEAAPTGQSSSLLLKTREQSMLSCPHCDKVFREERSRKCHIRDKHPTGADKKQKTKTEYQHHICPHCARSLVSEQVLQDHVRAKHSAIHKRIVPDWHQPQTDKEAAEGPTGAVSLCGGDNATPENDGAFTSDQDFGMGSICGLKYRHAKHMLEHRMEFVPTEASKTFRCTFCSKAFRERRAQLQHENFCSLQFTAK